MDSVDWFGLIIGVWAVIVLIALFIKMHRQK
mgnify:CR=1 FL=1